MDTCQDNRIEIQSPFPHEKLGDLFDWSRSFWFRVADDDTPSDKDKFLNAVSALHSRGNVTTFGVYRNNELGGYIRFDRSASNPTEGMGHCVFKKSFWGHATTKTAILMAAQKVYEMGVRHIQMPVYATNRAMLKLLDVIGATPEGQLAEPSLHRGQPVDVLIYGLMNE